MKYLLIFHLDGCAVTYYHSSNETLDGAISDLKRRAALDCIGSNCPDVCVDLAFKLDPNAPTPLCLVSAHDKALADC